MSSYDITSLTNCFSSQDSKSIQDYFKNFNDEVTLGLQESSNDGITYNTTSNALNEFVLGIVQNDLNNDLNQYVNDYNTVKGFNPYENELDHVDICVYPPNEQSSDINECYGTNEIGYDINPEDVSYLDLDSSQSNILAFNEVEFIPETFEEFLKLSIPTFIEPIKDVQTKKTIKKEDKAKRGRGRPRTDIKKLKDKVTEAEESNDKLKIRIKKNNKASKEYRDRRADKKKQLDMALAIQTDSFRKLKKIHNKLSLKIQQLENMIKMHPF